MQVIISDTSPLRALGHLGHMEWLQELFHRIHLPPAVAAELRHPPSSLAVVDVSAWRFLVVQSPSNRQRVSEFRLRLDAGEAEALALAEELHADLILVDELAGREVARQCGFPVLGTLGILVRAKQQQLCPAVAPLLDILQSELNFFVSVGLRQTILKQAGEAAP
jgi:predicted nucleic acid-binding protein